MAPYTQSWSLIAGGSLALFYATYYCRYTHQRLMDSVWVKGTIESVEMMRTGQKRLIGKPTVRFTDADGVVHVSSKSDATSLYSQKSIGRTVRIYYPPGRPELAKCGEFFDVWFLPLVGYTFAWGVLFSGLGRW